MKYFPLIWSGIWRKPMRSTLTIASVIIAFVLFGLLQGINRGMDAAVKSLRLDRLYVMNRSNATHPQPLAHVHAVEKIPGVRSVAHWTYFAGFYQEARNQVGAIAVDTAEFFALYPEIKVPAAQLAAMEHTRNGAIIGLPLARKFGWKIGDQVPLMSNIWVQKTGGNAYTFTIVGIFELSGRSAVWDDAFFLNYDYFDEARAFANGTVHMIIAGLADPRSSPQIAREIDAQFENSDSQTRTRNEQAYARTQMRQVADVGLITNAIVGAVLFTLLFVTGNTMMQSVRERMPEFAILKTLGFSDWHVLALVLAEALLLCVAAALAGLAISRVIYPRLAYLFGSIEMPAAVILIGIGVAALAAIISAITPAWRVKTLSVVDALAGR